MDFDSRVDLERGAGFAGVAYMDGAFGPVGDATISVLDFAFIRSDSTYDVVHVWKGKFFRLEDHLARFRASMADLRYEIPETIDDIRAILLECVRRSGFREAYVGMVCTRGRPPLGSRDMRLCRNRFIAYALPFIWIADPQKQERGLSASIASTVRIPSKSIDARVKNYNWLDMVRGLWEAYDRGADTAILLDLDGNVAEGPGFNVFCLRGGRLLTPRTNVLEGITRATVLDLAAEAGICVEVRDIPVDEFRDADEIFITSTGGGVIPVTTVDGRIFGNGMPGGVTLALMDAYWASHDDDRFATPVDYPA